LARRKLGLAGSFGARYGTVTRRRYAEVVSLARGFYECPRCRFKRVRRQSVGVWSCRKCGLTYTGGAYSPSTKLGVLARRALGKPLEAGAAAQEPEAEKVKAPAEPTKPSAKPVRAPRKPAAKARKRKAVKKTKKTS